MAAVLLAAAGACSEVPGTEPGKKIEVMTGEKKTHTVALYARETAVAIDANVAAGSRVRQRA